MYRHALCVFTLVFFSTLLVPSSVSFCKEKSTDLISLDMEKETVPDKASTSQVVSPAKPVFMTDRQMEESNLFDLIKKGGVVGYTIILLSVISLGLIISYRVTIRRGNILPSKDILLLQELVKDPTEEAIITFEKRRKSFLARVTVAGLRESSNGYQAMIKAMEDTGEALASGIARKTEHLNVIGNISPMMGLLGTVIGMLRCFNEIAHMTGAIEPRQLAAGIFEALVTTCMGLIVAIPALYCYALFRNRVDEFSGEASMKAEQLISGFKPTGKMS